MGLRENKTNLPLERGNKCFVMPCNFIVKKIQQMTLISEFHLTSFCGVYKICCVVKKHELMTCKLSVSHSDPIEKAIKFRGTTITFEISDRNPQVHRNLYSFYLSLFRFLFQVRSSAKVRSSVIVGSSFQVRSLVNL